MNTPLVARPAPNFDEFLRIMRGEQTPTRVPLIELSMDGVVMKTLTERFLGDSWCGWARGFEFTPPEVYFRQVVNLYYRLGYDCAPVWATWEGHPQPEYRVGADTASHDNGQRTWTEEGTGLIASWQDFEQFPWDALRPDTRPVEYAARHLPQGMKLTANTTYFEHIFENLLGVENMSYMLYDQPDLIEAVFQRWGEKVYSYYATVIDHDAVGAIFHADDMGFKTSTLISPQALRQYVLPWHRRFAALAHQHGKPFFIHSDGNLYKQGIIDDLIDDIGIDGKHGFEDVIMDVIRFKATYGDRIATFGGVDMDVLVGADEADLRAYIGSILEHNMPGGRFALGTGNTVANYVPLAHYLIILDTARGWEREAGFNQPQ